METIEEVPELIHGARATPRVAGCMGKPDVVEVKATTQRLGAHVVAAGLTPGHGLVTQVADTVIPVVDQLDGDATRLPPAAVRAEAQAEVPILASSVPLSAKNADSHACHSSHSPVSTTSFPVVGLWIRLVPAVQLSSTHFQ